MRNEEDLSHSIGMGGKQNKRIHKVRNIDKIQQTQMGGNSGDEAETNNADQLCGFRIAATEDDAGASDDKRGVCVGADVRLSLIHI